MHTSTLASATGTGSTTVRLSGLVSLTILLAACDARVSGPGAPTPAGPITPSSVTYTLSGVVSEMTPIGAAPLEGARIVEASGRTATTGADGYRVQVFESRYRFKDRGRRR